MALGANLAADLESIFTTFEAVDMFGEPVVLTQEHYAAWIAAAIDAYLIDGVYAGGAFTFSSGMDSVDLILPTEGTVIDAADKWSTALENYFKNGTTTPAAGNEAEAVIYTSVKPTLEAALTTVFSNINNTAAQQAADIAFAIEFTVASISAIYTITSGPTTVPVPAPAIL